jgi:hypothetical protein
MKFDYKNGNFFENCSKIVMKFSSFFTGFVLKVALEGFFIFTKKQKKKFGPKSEFLAHSGQHNPNKFINDSILSRFESKLCRI